MIETSPPDTPNTELTRFNALRHGILSRYTVLPWEDAEEYRAVVAALVAEHTPQGATGSIWSRKSLASYGASAGFGWRRLLPTGTDWTGHSPLPRQPRWRWCI